MFNRIAKVFEPGYTSESSGRIKRTKITDSIRLLAVSALIVVFTSLPTSAKEISGKSSPKITSYDAFFKTEAFDGDQAEMFNGEGAKSVFAANSNCLHSTLQNFIRVVVNKHLSRRETASASSDLALELLKQKHMIELYQPILKNNRKASELLKDYWEEISILDQEIGSNQGKRNTAIEKLQSNVRKILHIEIALSNYLSSGTNQEIRTHTNILNPLQNQQVSEQEILGQKNKVLAISLANLDISLKNKNQDLRYQAKIAAVSLESQIESMVVMQAKHPEITDMIDVYKRQLQNLLHTIPSLRGESGAEILNGLQKSLSTQANIIASGLTHEESKILQDSSDQSLRVKSR